MPVDVSPLHIGAGLRVLHLLLFHKAFCLLLFRFSYASTNFSFQGIIGGPLTTFNFSVRFSNFICIASVVLFMSPFVEYFWVRKFFLSLRERSTFAAGVSMMRPYAVSKILLGLWSSHRSRKAFESEVLRFCYLWVVKPPKGDFFCLSRVLSP